MAETNQTSPSVPAERVVYFDYLRVLSTFAVIVIHLCSQEWYYVDVNGISWQVLNFYMGCVRWAVPIFAMISGALFLGRNVPLKTIFSKYIFRLFTAYIFWNLLYAFFNGTPASDLLYTVIVGYTHMWFIPMIIGQYLCIPAYKQITASKEVTRYFLILSFAVTFLFPEILSLVRDFGSEFVVRLGSGLKYLQGNMNLNLVFGCSFYFIGGYYLHKTRLSRNVRIVIYLGGILGAAATILLDAVLSVQQQMPVDTYYGYLTLNVLLESLAVFTWVKHHCPRLPRLNAFIGRLSKYSFGAYLVHFLVIDQLDHLFGINALSFFPGLSIPALGALVFALSCAISWGLNQIPLLRKYIV